MAELISVKVSISNRTYPLRVTKEEEEKVLQAAQSINKRLKEFEESYAVKDKQDLLAMCALQFATEAMGHHKAEKKENRIELSERLDHLRFLIDDYLGVEAETEESVPA